METGTLDVYASVRACTAIPGGIVHTFFMLCYYLNSYSNLQIIFEKANSLRDVISVARSCGSYCTPQWNSRTVSSNLSVYRARILKLACVKIAYKTLPPLSSVILRISCRWMWWYRFHYEHVKNLTHIAVRSNKVTPIGPRSKPRSRTASLLDATEEKNLKNAYRVGDRVWIKRKIDSWWRCGKIVGKETQSEHVDNPGSETVTESAGCTEEKMYHVRYDYQPVHT